MPESRHQAFGGGVSRPPNLRRKRRRGGIAGIIFFGSFAGLLVLVIGSLVFNELRTGLTQARSDALRAQGMTIASVLAEAAVAGEPVPSLDENRARVVLRRLFREPNARLRLYTLNKALIADSEDLYDEIKVRELAPIGPSLPDLKKAAGNVVGSTRVLVQGALGDHNKALVQEIEDALKGQTIAQERINERGERVVSVSIPLQRVNAIVGVLTLESSDVSQIISRERWALVPFIGAAMLTNFLIAGALAWSIARPLRRLAAAADEVSSGQTHILSEWDLTERPDEIGELSEALSVMTESLKQRIDANESFAADVAHEIKNPLAAIRNAAELLQGNLQPAQRAKLESIIMGDINRVDKLVSDISNASRLDAELARKSREQISVSHILKSFCETYNAMVQAQNIKIIPQFANPQDPLWVIAREEAIGRIIINLLENAISFAPKGSKILVSGGVIKGFVRVTIEDEGIGIPQEAIERIFERFYTERPKPNSAQEVGGHGAFGSHSGLGLAIARQIAQSHDGRLYAKNRKLDGKIIGAKFVLELPNSKGK